MSETTTPKVFKLTKVVPGEVLMIIHPLSNPEMSRTIHLTNRNPYQMLPLDWALGIFMSDENYLLYKRGVITFDHNDILVKEAYEAGAYFGEELDFTPAKEGDDKIVLSILKSGNRKLIEDAVNKYGEEMVKNVAITHATELTTGVVNMLESMFKVQLVLDGNI